MGEDGKISITGIHQAITRLHRQQHNDMGALNEKLDSTAKETRREIGKLHDKVDDFKEKQNNFRITQAGINSQMKAHAESQALHIDPKDPPVLKSDTKNNGAPARGMITMEPKAFAAVIVMIISGLVLLGAKLLGLI